MRRDGQSENQSGQAGSEEGDGEREGSESQKWSKVINQNQLRKAQVGQMVTYGI